MHPLQPPALLVVSIQSLLQYPQLCGYPCCGKLSIRPLGDCSKRQIFLYKAAWRVVGTCCRTVGGYSPLRFLRWPEAVVNRRFQRRQHISVRAAVRRQDGSAQAKKVASSDGAEWLILACHP